MSRALEKLSSGLRVNKAADDAAGLAISEKMRSQVRGLDQAARNAQDGISLIQTAEGALGETHAILQRMRELSVQAANDTYTSEDRLQIQKEIDQLTLEVDRIAATAQFNGKNLLNGDMSALTSTDRLETMVFMRGGLRVVDQFGQKAPGGGNYKIEITAEAGAGEVQKSGVMIAKHDAFEGGQSIGRGIWGTFGEVEGLGRVEIVYQDTYYMGPLGMSGSYDSGSGTLTVTVLYDPLNTTVGELFGFMRSASAQTYVGGAGATTLNGIKGRLIGDLVFFDRRIGSGADADLFFTPPFTGVFVLTGAGYGSRVGMVAQEFTRLRDIEAFWNASGNFVLASPQSVSLTQGDGNRAAVALFAQDTVQGVTDKLNEAIYKGLKQNAVVSAGLYATNKFVTYVANTVDGTKNKSLNGTWVIESAVAGNDGRIAFSGNDNILNALSLTTIRKAKENIFTANVTDAHTQAVIANGVRFSGNLLIGAIHPNIDVKFDSNAGLSVGADGKADVGFGLTNQELVGSGPGGTGIFAQSVYTTFVHIADRTMVLHVGANQMQDIGVGIADMSAQALGVSNLLYSRAIVLAVIMRHSYSSIYTSPLPQRSSH